MARIQSALNETRYSPGGEGIASQGIGPSVTIPPKREVNRGAGGPTTIDVVQHRFNSTLLTKSTYGRLVGLECMKPSQASSCHLLGLIMSYVSKLMVLQLDRIVN